MACYYSLEAIIVFLFVLCYSTASEPDIETQCSKFKYDKQMLETMVRMEAKMNQWNKEKENFEENMLSVMEHRKVEMKQEFAKQNQQIGQILNDYKKIREELNDKTAYLEKLAGKLKNVVVYLCKLI
jgi:chromosome segregation ATPase